MKLSVAGGSDAKRGSRKEQKWKSFLKNMLYRYCESGGLAQNGNGLTSPLSFFFFYFSLSLSNLSIYLSIYLSLSLYLSCSATVAPLSSTLIPRRLFHSISWHRKAEKRKLPMARNGEQWPKNREKRLQILFFPPCLCRSKELMADTALSPVCAFTSQSAGNRGKVHVETQKSTTGFGCVSPLIPLKTRFPF